MKTTKEVLIWLHDNISPIYQKVTDGTIYTEAMLAGRDCREVGFIIPKYVNRGYNFILVAENMVGDSGHGNSFPQIDDRTYPGFITDTSLDDVEAYQRKSVECLEEKRKYLESKGYTKEKLGEDLYFQAIFASYNCGQGNVLRALANNQNIDIHTFGGDYSKKVMEYRYIYWDVFFSDQSLPVEGVQNDKHDTEVPECAKALAGHDELNKGEAGSATGNN